MTEHEKLKPAPSLADKPDTINKKQLERPIDLSSERIGLDDNTPAVLPIGTGGVPPEAN
jgi:hypothetical protein